MSRPCVSFVACCLLVFSVFGLTSCGESGTPVDVIAEGVSDVGGDVVVDDDGSLVSDLVDQDISALLDAEMVLIPGTAALWMGCNSEVDRICEPDESPYHEVTLSPYYIDKTEVTQGMYKVCVDAGVCDAPACGWNPEVDADKPVVCVFWLQAQMFCQWAGKRLPTEAEWEKAARGTGGNKYPWGTTEPSCVKAIMDDGNGESGCNTGGTWPVCSRFETGRGPFGLCDIVGNVSEWVGDWYAEDYYSVSPAADPTGPTSGTMRVTRGGSYLDGPYLLRTSDRGFLEFGGWKENVGFRCAKSM